MLHELSIANLGVIESARLTLGSGLTVVTGETGAGKTMVLTGLDLILGGKPVAAAVRIGADEALAEAVIDVPAGSDAARVLDDAGVIIDEDGSVVVSRTVGATTRSRTVVGGRTVPQALLAEVADDLVTVHGQSDQTRLKSPARQRATLDAYAGADHATLLTAYRDAWAGWNAATADLAEMQHGADTERLLVRALRDDVAAIEAVNPQPGEDAELAAQSQILENSEAVRLGVATARDQLDGDNENSVVSGIESARHALAESARHDPSLAPLAERIAEYSYGSADIAAELGTYLSRLDADPARLDAVQARRSELSGLMRRLGTDLPGVAAHYDDAVARIARDDAWDDILRAREEAVVTTRATLESSANALHASRAAAALRLADAVNAELATLAMPDAALAVDVQLTEPAAHGADAVTMTLASHPGAPQRPVAEAASGGELSRIMLALEVALAQAAHSEARTFVFDEVDAGVGGKAAVAVGERLAALARTHQVVVVTHLAQVAAFAHTHVTVAKSTDGSITRAQVREVTGEDRIQEIARLLSGQEDSTTARAHALELLEASSVAR